MPSIFPIASNLAAEKLPFELLTGVDWLTNSILVALLVVLIVLWFARRATRDVKLVPDGAQNAFEAILEILYDTVVEIVGPKMARPIWSAPLRPRRSPRLPAVRRRPAKTRV